MYRVNILKKFVVMPGDSYPVPCMTVKVIIRGGEYLAVTAVTVGHQHQLQRANKGRGWAEGGPGEHTGQVNGKTPKVNIGLNREISNKYLESFVVWE